MSDERPANDNDFDEVSLSKEIKSIRQPRQSFLWALIDGDQAGEDINDRLSSILRFWVKIVHYKSTTISQHI